MSKSRNARSDRENKLCDHCLALELKPQLNQNTKFGDLGTISAIQARSDHCVFCKLVFHTASPYKSLLEKKLKPGESLSIGISSSLNGRLRDIEVVCGEPGQNFRLGAILVQAGKLYPNDRDDFYLATFQAIHQGRLGPSPREPRFQHVDMAVIRGWLDNCLEKHIENCGHDRAEAASGALAEISLVDVLESRIVSAQPGARYMALSYVWGKVQMLQATRSNSSVLRQRGALSSLQKHIPPVIQDAMTLVRLLGERYLWVDILCIVQDDPVQKHAQIAQMDLIYSGSLLTIAALSSSDADARLPGVCHRSRTAVFSSAVAEAMRFVTQAPSLTNILDLMPYERRAWTLQERLLSPRCLYFTDSQVYFQCSSGLYSEDQPLGVRTKHEMDFHGRLNRLDEHRKYGTSWIAGFRVYESLVTLYCRRQLTYPADVLNAFSALSKTLERVYFGHFLEGLPEAVFDFGLLWIPAGPLQRRRHIEEGSPEEPPLFRSWSWAGWEGLVEFYSVLVSNDMNFTHRTFRSEIKVMAVENNGDLRIVERQKFVLQSGDERTNGKTQADLLEESRDDSAFQSLVQERLEYQRAHSANTPSPVPGQNVLHFWAQSIRATSFAIQPGTHGHSAILATQIFDSKSRHCGLLFDNYHSIYTQAQLPDCEYILLSRIKEHRFYHTVSSLFVAQRLWSYDHYGWKGPEWCACNVMLIRWQGKVAERVAIGMIHGNAWEDSAPIPRYIRLG
jgi:hypothetical protein